MRVRTTEIFQIWDSLLETPLDFEGSSWRRSHFRSYVLPILCWSFLKPIPWPLKVNSGRIFRYPRKTHRKTEKVVDIHLKDIDNARLIVSFRELTYQWWFVTGSLSGWCLLYSSLDFRPCTRLGFTFVGNQRVSFVLQTQDLVKNLTRNRSENDVYSFFLFKKKLQFRCCLARLVSHIHYRAASRTDVPDCERPPLIDFDWLSGLDNGIWKGRQCGTLP